LALGAEYGVKGLCGQTYTIPVMHRKRVLPFEEIKKHVDIFLSFAKHHMEITFLLMPIDALSASELKSLFAGVSDNVILAEELKNKLT
jgi:hypothetical protein